MKAIAWKIGFYASIIVTVSFIYDVIAQLNAESSQQHLSDFFHLRAILAVIVLAFALIIKVPDNLRKPFSMLFVSIILGELPVGFVGIYSPWKIIARTIALIVGAYAAWEFRKQRKEVKVGEGQGRDISS